VPASKHCSEFVICCSVRSHGVWCARPAGPGLGASALKRSRNDGNVNKGAACTPGCAPKAWGAGSRFFSFSFLSDEIQLNLAEVRSMHLAESKKTTNSIGGLSTLRNSVDERRHTADTNCHDEVGPVWFGRQGPNGDTSIATLGGRGVAPLAP